jgi:hypothetical protein
MTTFQGGTPPLESISSYRLYVDPSGVEVEFINGKPNPLYLQSVLGYTARTPNTRPNQDQQRMPGQPYKPLVAKAPPYPYASGQLVDFTVKPAGTMLRWLESQGGKFAPLLSFIRYFKLEPYLDATDQSGKNMYTLLAPVDCSKLWTEVRRGSRSPEELLRYLMLGYPLLPVQLMNHRLRVQTTLDQEFVLLDGINMTVRDGEGAVNPNLPVLGGGNRITQSKETDNGIIYVLDQSITPFSRY